MPNESLLKRLRDAGNDYTVAWGSGELYDEAADEIERLTAAIERIRAGIATDRCDGDTEWAAGVNAACHNHLKLVDATIAEGVQPLGHEDDLLALCARLDGDDLRDSDHATAAATIRSLCQQLDAARASAIGGVQVDGGGSRSSREWWEQCKGGTDGVRGTPEASDEGGPING